MIVFTEEILKKYFKHIKTIEFNEGWNSKICPQCNCNDLKYEESEPWTNIYICNNCNSILYVKRADRMGGNWTEPVSIYCKK